MKGGRADNHLETLAIRGHLGNLLVHPVDQVTVALGQQPVLSTQSTVVQLRQVDWVGSDLARREEGGFSMRKGMG